MASISSSYWVIGHVSTASNAAFSCRHFITLWSDLIYLWQRRRYKIMFFTASHRNNFVGGKCALPIALLVRSMCRVGRFVCTMCRLAAAVWRRGGFCDRVRCRENARFTYSTDWQRIHQVPYNIFYLISFYLAYLIYIFIHSFIRSFIQSYININIYVNACLYLFFLFVSFFYI